MARVFNIMKKIDSQTDDKLEEVEFEARNGNEVEFHFDGQATNIGFDLGEKGSSTWDNEVEDVVNTRSGDPVLSEDLETELLKLAPLIQNDVEPWGFDEIKEVELEFKSGNDIEIAVKKSDTKISEVIDLRASP